MSYAVKEIFYTLQGEGAHTGRPTVFCRFAGCNLWSGREEDRSQALCDFCDTDFVGTDSEGGGHFASADDLARSVASAWPGPVRAAAGRAFVVCTGGEPLLQLDGEAIGALHRLGFEVAVETNGTEAAPSGPERLDWICVSPKAGTEVVLRSGDELKLIYPQKGAEPEQFVRWSFRHFYLQPMDGPDLEPNTRLALEYCLEHPQWKLSLQTHKLLGIR